MISDFKIFPIMLLRQANFGFLSVQQLFYVYYKGKTFFLNLQFLLLLSERALSPEICLANFHPRVGCLLKVSVFHLVIFQISGSVPLMVKCSAGKFQGFIYNFKFLFIIYQSDTLIVFVAANGYIEVEYQTSWPDPVWRWVQYRAFIP